MKCHRSLSCRNRSVEGFGQQVLEQQFVAAEALCGVQVGEWMISFAAVILHLSARAIHEALAKIKFSCPCNMFLSLAFCWGLWNVFNVGFFTLICSTFCPSGSPWRAQIQKKIKGCRESVREGLSEWRCEEHEWVWVQDSLFLELRGDVTRNDIRGRERISLKKIWAPWCLNVAGRLLRDSGWLLGWSEGLFTGTSKKKKVCYTQKQTAPPM